MLGALFEPFSHVCWVCTYLNDLFGRLSPGCCSLLSPVSLGIFWSAISSEALFLTGIEKVGCRPVAWAEALCRNRLGSSLLAPPGPWSCWLWRAGLAWQLSSRRVFPIHTHIVHYLRGSVQWTDTCLLPVVESARLWALGIWDLEFRAIWPVPQLSLCCDKCLLSRMCLFFQMVLTPKTPVPHGVEAFPAAWDY